MQLSDYLKQRDIPQHAFAGMIGVDQSTVARYVTPSKENRRIPELEVMRRIVKVTGGEVAANDFYEIEAPHE